MTRGCGVDPASLFEQHRDCSGTKGNQRIRSSCRESFGVEALPPFEDQGIRLALATTAPDDEVPTIAHGLGFSRGMPPVRKGSGGLLTSVLHLSLGPGSVAGGGNRPPSGDFGGGVLAVSQRRNIPSRN